MWIVAAVVILAGIAYFATRAKAVEPEPTPPVEPEPPIISPPSPPLPEPEPPPPPVVEPTPPPVPEPELKAQFYMPPTVEASVVKTSILRVPINRITFSCLITNKGNASGTHTFTARAYWNNGTEADPTLSTTVLNEFWDRTYTITLAPGGTHKWSKVVDVWQGKRATLKLKGDWEDNNTAIGVVV